MRYITIISIALTLIGSMNDTGATCITGTVLDDGTGAGLAGVTITLGESTAVAETDADGNYSICDGVLSVHSGTATVPAAAKPVRVHSLRGVSAPAGSPVPLGIYLTEYSDGSTRKTFMDGRLYRPQSNAVTGKTVTASTDSLTFFMQGFTTVTQNVAGATLNLTMNRISKWGVDRPGKHITGPSGTLTPYDGPRDITEDGAVYENFTKTGGTINIKAGNVILRNFRIDAGGASYGINVMSGAGITIEDGEIFNVASCAILGDGYTGRRLYIHESNGDGLKVQGDGDPTVIEHCFIEKLGKADGAHADGNQTRTGSNITFRYNNIYMPYPGTPEYPGTPYKSNATFMLQLTITGFLIENNWLTGGNYTIYSPGGVSVLNNVFSRFNRGYGENEELHIKTGTFVEWSGNVWEDTGTACP